MDMLAYSQLVDNYNLCSLTCVVYASGKFDCETVQAVRKRLNIKHMRQQYGMTETMGMLITPSTGTINSASIGKLREGVWGKVVCIETGALLGPGQSGEMMFKSLYNMKGYVNDAEATKNVYDADGFLRTGDIGYFDANDEWFFVDRIKGIIRYYGHIVMPMEIEYILLLHTKIIDCCVVGWRNDVTYEKPVAFIVRDGTDLTETQVHDHLARFVAPPKRLYGGVKFVESLPKSIMGKNCRYALKAMLVPNGCI